MRSSPSIPTAIPTNFFQGCAPGGRKDRSSGVLINSIVVALFFRIFPKLVPSRGAPPASSAREPPLEPATSVKAPVLKFSGGRPYPFCSIPESPVLSALFAFYSVRCLFPSRLFPARSVAIWVAMIALRSRRNLGLQSLQGIAMTHRLTRSELYSLVRSQPMQRRAKEFGVSDVALAKLCRGAEIPVPERGYWAKSQAGKKVTRIPLPSRGPGGVGRRVGRRPNYRWYEVSDEELLEPIPLPAEFPVGIEETRKIALKTIGKIKVPSTIIQPHPVDWTLIGRG